MDLRHTALAWPGGRTAALTTSWDDGTVHDRRLVALFNRHGLKGTFNLNAGFLEATARDDARHIAAGEVAGLFAGHEIAAHAFRHPWLGRLPDEAVVAEIMQDRRKLEELAGYPVKGMALPFGEYSPRALAVLSACGVVHCRTTVATRDPGALPRDFLEWHPTCHHKDPDLPAYLAKILDGRACARLLYVWGHSFEFDREGNWDLIERFAAETGPDERIWHATNMEVVDYLTAWRGLRWSADGSRVHNPSATAVWLRRDDRGVELAPGKLTVL